MKKFTLLMVAAATVALGSGAAVGQGHNGGGGRDGASRGGSGNQHGSWHGGGNRANGRGGFNGGWRGGYQPRFAYRGGSRVWGGAFYPFYYPYAYAYPYPIYAAPAYPIYADAGPTVYVERSPSPAYAEPTPLYDEPPPPEPTRVPEPLARLERYTLSARELFEFDRAMLRMPQPKLDEIAGVLVRNPQINHVTISGYTDRIGTNSYNLKLSQRRADAVKTYLVGKGVTPIRLTAIGKGEANPVVQCPEMAKPALIKCLEANRRVEVEQITVERRIR